MDETCTLYTIGHSHHAIQQFIALLRQHAITTVVDVRSQPYSQWAHQFNRELLQHDLEEAGIGYVYMGDVLGGRPADAVLYARGNGRPDYGKMAAEPTYQAAIRQLLILAGKQTTTIMCSEGDHRECHRHLLITRSLLDLNATVAHIQTDGTCVAGAYEPEQLSLFG